MKVTTGQLATVGGSFVGQKKRADNRSQSMDMAKGEE
jgi:hypothetical protein